MKKSLLITLSALLVFSLFLTNSYAARPSKTRTAVKIGAGTALGTGIGALIGGKRGAASGALLGGGVATGHSLARRDSGYGRKTRALATVITGSTVGAGVGTAVGGGKGAAIGALVGGGGSTIYALSRKDLRKPSYTSSYRARR
ncbi:MAG: hypothetical protein JNN15_01730, partial [Blastocatellia bacterium]|nr:hypothetical protein [Blastocatellia bacterium]